MRLERTGEPVRTPRSQVQAQRHKITLYGELELKKRLFREIQAKDCQEIEELKRICRGRTRSLPVSMDRRLWFQFVLQEIDLSLEFGRDGVHDSLGNLRIKSLELHTVFVKTDPE